MKKYKRTKKFFLFVNDDLKKHVYSIKNKNSKKLYCKYVYILHLIIHYHTMCDEMYTTYGKRINVKKYRSFFGSTEISGILKNLQQWGYIEMKKRPVTGKHAATYKLTESYEKARLTMVHFSGNDSAFVRKTLELERQPLKNKVLKVLEEVYKNHISVSNECLSYFENKYPSPGMDRLIDLYRSGEEIKIDDSFNEIMETISIDKEDFGLFSFVVKDYYVTNPKKSERVYSNFCNLKREKRDFIQLQGAPLISIDLRCSQVVFSIPVIKEAMGDITEDFKAYKEAALYQDFYQELANQAGVILSTDQARTDFKKQFFIEVFFSNPAWSGGPIKRAFETLYPSVLETINTIKKGDHGKFAVKLQNLESQLINFSVLNTLQDEGHVALSLHDAIYVNNEASLERAKVLIKESFLVNHGLDIRFKEELEVDSMEQLPIAA